MLAQHRDDSLRDTDDAPPGFGLRRPEQDFSGRSLHEGNAHPHGSGLQVKISAPQRGRISPNRRKRSR
jgi:hypothetical protein